AVIPIGGPIATEHEVLWIDRPAIEVGDLSWMGCISEIHDGDTTLVPGLYFNVTAGNGNERAVVRYAVLRIALGSRQLVIAGKFQLVILQIENRVRAPNIRVIRPATRAKSAAPFIGENDFLSIIRKRSRVPVCIVWIIHCIHSLWIRRIFNVQENSIAR